jgi:hypothetical protein
MNELWENPLYTVEERLEMAVGGILFRDRCLKQAYERLNQANQRLREVANLMPDTFSISRTYWLTERAISASYDFRLSDG